MVAREGSTASRPQARHIKTSTQTLLEIQKVVRTQLRGWRQPSKSRPRLVQGIGSAQPDHSRPAQLTPSRHRARETARQVSAPAGSGVDTWEYFLPYKLAPPGVPHTPS
eukprot:5713362-Amphidinium_carterae.1